jgi:hypothetical protein
LFYRQLKRYARCGRGMIRLPCMGERIYFHGVFAMQQALTASLSIRVTY